MSRFIGYSIPDGKYNHFTEEISALLQGSIDRIKDRLSIEDLKHDLLDLKNEAKRRLESISDDYDIFLKNSAGPENKRIKVDEQEKGPLSAFKDSPNTNDYDSRQSTPGPGAYTPTLQTSRRKAMAKYGSDILTNAPLSTFGSRIEEFMIARDDFSKVKITNQVSSNAFWTAMDYYFRNLTEEDFDTLAKSKEDSSLFRMAPKETHYIQRWANEEASCFPELMQVSKLKMMISRLMNDVSKGKYDESKPESPGQLSDEGLVSSALRCPPLTERIFGALVDNNLVSLNRRNSFKPSIVEKSEADNTVAEVPTFEDRIKRELFCIGVLDKPDVDWNNTEDDEVAVEIRSLQNKLRSQMAINNMRKERLLEVAKQYMAFQEYRSIVEELDKQIEQTYAKLAASVMPFITAIFVITLVINASKFSINVFICISYRNFQKPGKENPQQ
ncbi:Chromatin-remodeling complexes subunit ngg1 [Zancudomyces culisetae]|uniref:Chromatin-remodeling complexes subunit ngg1 n=1 Tax=Zancudomyces culisetae TaxID=1213189 RepID=A0A1R1PXR4_ZANCU|nr:Chromatin-remodeling complexes subunit ngg1 [Zancudomyces culisetae]|eukprot:OMH85761.1 Chromatin-remodeling complexes subunit ngg1 [Zancudomyces culisetae]